MNESIKTLIVFRFQVMKTCLIFILFQESNVKKCNMWHRKVLTAEVDILKLFGFRVSESGRNEGHAKYTM